jgi:hypothetical protein
VTSLRGPQLLKKRDSLPMSEGMQTLGVGSVLPLSKQSQLQSREERADQVSPELALIDEALAAHARESLPEPEDTVDRLWRAVAAERPPARPVAVIADRRTTRRRRGGVIAALGLATTAVALGFDGPIEVGAGDDRGASSKVGDAPRIAVIRPPTASDVRVERPTARAKPSAGEKKSTPTGRVAKKGRTSARAKPSAGEKKSTPTGRVAKKGRTSAARGGLAPAERGQPSREGNRRKVKAPPPRPSGRRFSWAPVPRATGYHVEFFRGDARVYAASTQSSEISLPSRWRFRGRLYRLSPGDYRWYVWPVFGDGDRAPTASVQARLHVSDSPA